MTPKPAPDPSVAAPIGWIPGDEGRKPERGIVNALQPASPAALPVGCRGG